MHAAPLRSLFVTNLAWLSIVLAGAHVLMALLQNVVYAVAPLPVVEADELLPPFVVWVFAHLRWLMLANLLLGVFWLWASIDLLRRRGWARIAFVGLSLFGIVATIVGTLWQFHMLRSIVELMQPLEGEAAGMATGMMTWVPVVAGVIAVALCWLQGWIAWRLLQPAVAREFGS